MTDTPSPILRGRPLWLPPLRAIRPALCVRTAAREAGSRPALLLPDGRTWNWRRVAAEVLPRAARLRDLCAGRPVAMLLHPEPESVLGVLAALQSGVPLLPLHPARPERSLQELTRRAGALRLDPHRLQSGTSACSRPLPPRTAASPLAPAALVATSGTTGRPRLAALSARALLAAAAGSRMRLGPSALRRWALGLSLAHVGGLMVLVRALVTRSAVVLPPEARFDPYRWSVHLSERGATGLSLVPTMLRRWIERGAPPPPSLRVLLLGGAACPEPLWREALHLGWPVRLTYGLTESCGQLCTWTPWARPGEHVGSPLPGVALRLADNGEILARAPSILRHWWPEGSATRSDGWLETGDLGRIGPNDTLCVLGRCDDRIQSGGENVDPLEVERALLALPGVMEACVFGTPSRRWGEAVSAALRLRDEAPWRAAPARIRDALSDSLPRFARPRRIAFLDTLPTGPTGKVDRRACRRACDGRWALDLED